MGLGHGVKQEQLDLKRNALLPVFESMPKSMYGLVGLDALQYMVHRYFLTEHGWSIRGFAPSGAEKNISDISSAAKILAEKLPSYIEAVLERKLQHQGGFALSDVVTMVAVLERMIFDEAVEMLESAYRMRGFETRELLTASELEDVMHSYMLIYSFGASSTNQTKHAEILKAVENEYPDGYPSSLYGLSELKTQLEQSRKGNPFLFPGESSE